MGTATYFSPEQAQGAHARPPQRPLLARHRDVRDGRRAGRRSPATTRSPSPTSRCTRHRRAAATRSRPDVPAGLRGHRRPSCWPRTRPPRYAVGRRPPRRPAPLPRRPAPRGTRPGRGRGGRRRCRRSGRGRDDRQPARAVGLRPAHHRRRRITRHPGPPVPAPRGTPPPPAPTYDEPRRTGLLWAGIVLALLVLGVGGFLLYKALNDNDPNDAHHHRHARADEQAARRGHQGPHRRSASWARSPQDSAGQRRRRREHRLRPGPGQPAPRCRPTATSR